MSLSYPKRILSANIYDLVKETPLERANGLSARYGQSIYIKREDLQPVHSFKIRGAYNCIKQLSDAELQRGVVAASAGNHAQGLALAAAHLGGVATIVMPCTTPQIKVDGVRARGGHVILHGDTFDEASAHALALATERGLIYIHPFDDPHVIAGQGTVGVEILRQAGESLDAIFLPVGGGGLAAGVAAWVKFLNPQTKIIAVEPEDAACLKAALDQGERVMLERVGLFADGVAVAQIGEHTFDVLKNTVDEVVTCTTDEICAAIKDIFDENRSIAEPAGALSLAGLKKYLELNPGAKGSYVAVESGANTNFDRLRYIAERTEVGEQREGVFAVTIPETKGSFGHFCESLGKRAVSEFNYRYNGTDTAQIFVGIKVESGEVEREQLLKQFASGGYAAHDLTDNELAKSHTRYMVGGIANIATERVFRARFPERPGALAEFLETLGGRWNITLFHYRNHGAAYGRVFFGLDIEEHELAELAAQLSRVGFDIVDETNNAAFSLFMK